ncbi:MAG: hypothetical protein JSS46_06200 [Proteobacteria bacterium]|jgi:hypothetical protein|nr:hypothetical protein [Pseudomonadota bacterium]
MSSHRLATTALTAVLLTAAAPALAVNCYAVVDRNDQVVYQSVRSPVDLSSAGTAVRDALRAKGEQLIAMDTRSCPEVDTSNISGDHKPATVAEIVAGMRPALRYGRATGAEVPDVTSSGGLDLPRIVPPVATDGGVSTSGVPSGMSLR